MIILFGLYILSIYSWDGIGLFYICGKIIHSIMNILSKNKKYISYINLFYRDVIKNIQKYTYITFIE